MSEENKKLIYLMHIPWTWAKQRPQFLAEELNDEFQVDVIYKKPFSGKNQSLEKARVSLVPLRLLPFNARSGVVRMLNRLLTAYYLSSRVSACKFVWVTSPDLFALLPKLRSDQVLIYDCMDDMLSFSSIKDNRNVFQFFREIEKLLINRADVVLCSSNNLAAKLKARYNVESVHIVNNGISDSLFQVNQSEFQNVLNTINGKTNIVYIGTISKWMDWNMILLSLNVDQDLVYHFVGPMESPVPIHERILAYGPKSHQAVKGIMAESDILIMPFIVNDLIESVNPVKLYEYIYSGKPCVSVRYGETETFQDYVYLYNGLDEYLGILKELKKSDYKAKSEYSRAVKFCESNSWSQRGKAIREILKIQ